MPFPLIPILLGGGVVAAAARGASWVAEQNVKEVNSEVAGAEQRAAEKNRQYAEKRLQCKAIYESMFLSASKEYNNFLINHAMTEEEVQSLKPEPWLQERLGDLTIGRPLLIEPAFHRPATMEQMTGFRLYQAGQNLSRTHPALGQKVQGAGMLYAAGAYISAQTNLVIEANKYVAAARLYIQGLNTAIGQFDSRFASEVAEDQRSVNRIAHLLDELSSGGAPADSCAIVRRTLLSYLSGLVGRYS